MDEINSLRCGTCLNTIFDGEYTLIPEGFPSDLVGKPMCSSCTDLVRWLLTVHHRERRKALKEFTIIRRDLDIFIKYAYFLSQNYICNKCNNQKEFKDFEPVRTSYTGSITSVVCKDCKSSIKMIECHFCGEKKKVKFLPNMTIRGVKIPFGTPVCKSCFKSLHLLPRTLSPMADKLWREQNGACPYCGEMMTTVVGPREATIDHIIARSVAPEKFDVEDESNKVLACAECNVKKDNMPITKFLEQYGIKIMLQKLLDAIQLEKIWEGR